MFAFPAKTLVDRVIPKSKILANARPTPRQKTLLTSQIQQIRWLAKLSPETTQLPATQEAPEIQFFQLTLKDREIHADLLQLIDKAIPQPLFFALVTPNGDQAIAAAYKRPSDSDHSQWVLGPRFLTDFRPPPPDPLPLPSARDLTELYRALFDPLLPLAARDGESLLDHIERCEQHRALQRKAEQLANKVHQEKQFNRRVELNQQLKTLQAELSQLELP